MKAKGACKTPCKGCPFARHVEAGELGGSPVEVYIGQAHLPMWLPCHSEKGYAGKESVNMLDKIGQCSGAARLRQKLKDKHGLPFEPVALQDDPDDKAFDTIEEFVEHHTGLKCPTISPLVLNHLMGVEMDKVKANAHRCVRLIER